MIRTGPVVTMAAIAAFCVTSALAQAPRVYEPTIPRMQPEQRRDSAIPRGAQEQRVEPAGELGGPAPAPFPPRLVQNERRTQRDSDARHCLTLATNKAVHRCAERYRSRAARAAAVKKASAKAKPAAPLTIEAANAPEVVKPGAPPRPGDVAKAAELVKPMDVTKPGGTPRPVESAGKTREPAKPAAAAPAPAPMAKSTPAATPPAKAPEAAKSTK